MFWIKKLDWWIELKTHKTIFLKRNIFYIQYHFDVVYKKNLKNLEKFNFNVYSTTRLNFSHNWHLINIFKKKKCNYLCICVLEEFFFNKNFEFFKITLYSKKKKEKLLTKIQFYNIIPVYCRIILAVVFFLNSKLCLSLRHIFGINFKTFSSKFNIKSWYISNKNKLPINFLFIKLKRLSFIGLIFYDENFFFLSIWKKYLIFLKSKTKFGSSFSIFLNLLVYNSDINLLN
nr:hypothetical protein CcurKRNrm3_p152 [Cryptomonas curvata]